MTELATLSLIFTATEGRCWRILQTPVATLLIAGNRPRSGSGIEAQGQTVDDVEL